MKNITPATLRGHLGRYFEELCRIKHSPLRSAVVTTGTRLKRRQLPKHGGVYAFWWVGGADFLLSAQCNRDMILKGSGGRDVMLRIDDKWLGINTNLPLPLYVGKSAGNISNRVGQHLMLGHERILRLGKGARKAKAPSDL